MPEIKLQHVVSCSTEDNTHKADNLLSSDTYRKWKAARAGEKQTSVILQFEKEEQVHSMDIGNEGSAFVEVLVGNSSSIREQDYEVLLVTSSFMSPTESRNGTNMNRVRFFGPGQLQKSTAQGKWDRVKIVCSQPYSKNIAYGLAFVKFHSPPDKNDPPVTSPKLTKLGQFRVKEDAPSSGTNLQPGSLFFSRDIAAKSSTSPKVSPPSNKLSYATAALQASGPASSSFSSSASPQPPAKRKFEFSKERQSAPGAPPAKKSSPGSSPEFKHATPKLKRSTLSPSTPKASPSKAAASAEKKWASLPKPKQQKATKAQNPDQVPFKRIMEGVVFVLSGFQNPFRGELREKALEMGAKYRPDWTPDSTHLICAFTNTPKYSQVKSAGGIIVHKEWVMDCHKRKQKISYKRYLMDGAELSSESEMEADEQSEEEISTKTPPKPQRQVTPKKQAEERQEDEYAASTDVDDEPDADDDSAADTEDELQRVETKNRQKKVAASKAPKEEDPYSGSTDENTDAEEEQDHLIPELPDYLKGKHFFLYGKFPDSERRLLTRYIVAFNGLERPHTGLRLPAVTRWSAPGGFMGLCCVCVSGSTLEDYMSDKVHFVVTSQGWHDSFEDMSFILVFQSLQRRKAVTKRGFP
ncbi:DNA repair protein XRCC1 isoform X3 [Dunckerocampus dactyliophorus]|uniref:DNA repair protein XRCC1 isoform X3 n=1 Tax=Dunckerocampus dactyliophorus TaxID=161453 RepID=UPI0024052BD5|nr:DNA repair protein XRCC1 isoform X3 [Dunckerocampus dactyliophorus]XP_054637067.1 DNA repair protein XRCC1 isoform X3 [Dunckerocampus dactyliophorus]